MGIGATPVSVARVRSRLLAVVLVFGLLASLSGATLVSRGARAADAARPVRVLIVGDSIVHQPDAVLRQWFGSSGIDLELRRYAGTAMCDWLKDMKEAIVELDPDVVIASFVGNNLTTCMTNRTGSEFGQVWLDAYASDARTMARGATSRGADFYITEVLPMRDDLGPEALEEVFRTTPGVSAMFPTDRYFAEDSAGSGGWALSLPAMYPWEPSSARVRSVHEVHLAPLGEIRFAVMLASITEWLYREGPQSR